MRENSIRFKIGIQLESIFVPSELIQCKIGFQLELNFVTCVPSNLSFLIFIPNELILCKKTRSPI